MKFNIVMPFSSSDGYGYSGETLVLAAKKYHQANVGVIAHDWQERDWTDPALEALEVPTWDVDVPLVVYFIPYAFNAFRADTAIGQTMFETTEIPDVWAQFCSIPKGLIVPSLFNYETFSKKVDKPIEIVPLGVDIDTYHYVDREPSKVFTFLMAGALHYRKGVEFAVRAFKEEFSEKEPVRLVLKTHKGFLDYGKETLRDDIEVVNWNYSRAEMLDLYQAADCFVACSRGEASGLTPREAMATGIPAIVTDWGGLKEIARPDCTYPVAVESLEAAPPACSSYDIGITQGQSIGDFARPSITDIRGAMRAAYENQEENLAMGRRAADWMAKDWNYNVCSGIWLDAIERIANG